jgi:hypothetical protein
MSAQNAAWKDLSEEPATVPVSGSSVIFTKHLYCGAFGAKIRGMPRHGPVFVVDSHARGPAVLHESGS